MVKLIKEFDSLITINDYLEKYHTKLSDSWHKYQKYIDDAFNIQTGDDYKAFLKEFYVSKFDYEKMREFYKKIKIDLSFFDDDILRYIAFIEGLDFFEKIGNPSWDVWLNAKNLNKPFEKYDEYSGFSIMGVMYLKYGGNAIRNQLLSVLRYINIISW